MWGTKLAHEAGSEVRDWHHGTGRWRYIKVTSIRGLMLGVLAVVGPLVLAFLLVGPRVESREYVAWTFGVTNAALVILLLGKYDALQRLVRAREDAEQETNNRD